MTYCKLFLLLTISIFISCSDAEEIEEEVCTLNDWLGEYSGTIICGNASGDVIVTISEILDSALVATLETGITTELDPFNPSNCTYESNNLSGSRTYIKYERTGNQLTIEEEFETGSCTTNAVKQ